MAAARPATLASATDDPARRELCKNVRRLIMARTLGADEGNRSGGCQQRITMILDPSGKKELPGHAGVDEKKTTDRRAGIGWHGLLARRRGQARRFTR